MEIIIYSKTLDQLDRDIANTSSKIFEIEFAKALSQYANVSIVSMLIPAVGWWSLHCKSK